MLTDVYLCMCWYEIKMMMMMMILSMMLLPFYLWTRSRAYSLMTVLQSEKEADEKSYLKRETADSLLWPAENRLLIL